MIDAQFLAIAALVLAAPFASLIFVVRENIRLRQQIKAYRATHPEPVERPPD